MVSLSPAVLKVLLCLVVVAREASLRESVLVVADPRTALDSGQSQTLTSCEILSLLTIGVLL